MGEIKLIKIKEPSLKTTEIRVVKADQGQLTVEWKTLVPPKKFGYWIGVYPSNEIVWSVKPQFFHPIPYQQHPIGAYTFNHVPIGTSEYIVCLGVAPGILTSICASCTIPSIDDEDEGKIFSPSLGKIEQYYGTILFNYITVKGNHPQNNRNWVGIWRNESPAFNGKGCLKREWVKNSQHKGQYFLNFRAKYDAIYTIAYATGKRWKDVCMYKTFLAYKGIGRAKEKF
jgi:hypothetical protein